MMNPVEAMGDFVKHQNAWKELFLISGHIEWIDFHGDRHIACTNEELREQLERLSTQN